MFYLGLICLNLYQSKNHKALRHLPLHMGPNAPVTTICRGSGDRSQQLNPLALAVRFPTQKVLCLWQHLDHLAKKTTQPNATVKWRNCAAWLNCRLPGSGNCCVDTTVMATVNQAWTKMVAAISPVVHEQVAWENSAAVSWKMILELCRTKVLTLNSAKPRPGPNQRVISPHRALVVWYSLCQMWWIDVKKKFVILISQSLRPTWPVFS